MIKILPQSPKEYTKALLKVLFNPVTRCTPHEHRTAGLVRPSRDPRVTHEGIPGFEWGIIPSDCTQGTLGIIHM